MTRRRVFGARLVVREYVILFYFLIAVSKHYVNNVLELFFEVIVEEDMQ
jgi:hypothetical protein